MPNVSYFPEDWYIQFVEPKVLTNPAKFEKANKHYTSDFKRKVYQSMEKIWLKTPHSYLNLKLATSVSYALLTCKNLELSLEKVLRIKKPRFRAKYGSYWYTWTQWVYFKNWSTANWRFYMIELSLKDFRKIFRVNPENKICT